MPREIVDEPILKRRDEMQKRIDSICGGYIVLGDRTLQRQSVSMFAIFFKFDGDLIPLFPGSWVADISNAFLRDIIYRLRFGKGGFLEGLKIEDKVGLNIVLRDYGDSFGPNSYRLGMLRNFGVPINTNFPENTRVFNATLYVGFARILTHDKDVEKINLLYKF